MSLLGMAATILLRGSVAIRRHGLFVGGFVATFSFGSAVAKGWFDGAKNQGPLHALLGLAWLTLLALQLRRRTSARSREWLDAQVALQLVIGAYAVIQLSGGLRSELYPLLYVLVAFLVAITRPAIWAVSITGAALLEGFLWLRLGTPEDVQAAAIHIICIVLFALLHLFFTRGEIARVRLEGKRVLEDERTRRLDLARDYRLLGAPRTGEPEATPGGRSGTEERLVTASVDEIRQSVYVTLDLLKRTLGCHTCVLLWLDHCGSQLKLAEVATDSDDIEPGPFPAAGGAVAGAIKRRVLVNMETVREGYRGIPYYRSPSRVERFVAVPVMESGHLRGVLCADRVQGPAFTPGEEDILQLAVRSILRASENERIFVQVERAKWEQSRLYRASQALGSALGEQQVLEATLRAVREIAEYDFAAVTYYDAQSRQHTIRRAEGHLRQSFEGLEFRDNTALAAMAVKNRSTLPYRGEFDPREQVVFTPKARLEGMQSLLILPLVSGDQAIGSLTIAAHRRDAFGASVRPILEVISIQMAVSLANARMVRRLEELATTDGLTGLHNHRVFQDELDARLKSAARFGRRLSVVLLDIDHFKRVNDEFGHPSGDAVLRVTARLLERCKRETDLVARYGGEEFVIVCEQTDRSGAGLLAERVRRELEAEVLMTEQGRLKVTCSLGIATYPVDATSKVDLVARADQALYQAKRGGRNRAVAWGHVAGAKAS